MSLLITNNSYVISFYSRSLRNISNFEPVKLIFGYSQNDSTFGAAVDTTSIPDIVWTKQFIYLTPQYDAEYVTVMGLPGSLRHYTIVDNFSFDTTGLYLYNKNLQKEPIQLFPNPCTQILKLKISNLSHFNILNLMGEIVILQVIQTEKEYVIIDVSNLSSGIYFIQAIVDERIFTQKFLKY